MNEFGLKTNLELYSLDDLDLEIWKNINMPDLKYRYQISNYGRFRNATTGNIIKPYFTFRYDSDGTKTVDYYRAVMHTNDPHKTIKVSIHRLVALYFVNNPDTEKYIEVDHKDGNKLNNHYTNLEWVTTKENIIRALDMKLRVPKIGEKNALSKWSESEVRYIWKCIQNKLNYSQIYEKYSTIFENPKSLIQLKNLYYNLTHKTNPKWVHITQRKI